MYQTIKAASRAIKSPEATVCLHFSNSRGLDKADKAYDKSVRGALSDALKTRKECTGAAGEATVVYTGSGKKATRTIILGLGASGQVNADVVRRAFGSLASPLHAMAVKRVTVRASAGICEALGDEPFARAVGEGLGLGAFRFDDFKATIKNGKGSGPTALTASVERSDGSGVANDGLSHGLNLAESANFARRLAATPPNVATTTHIAACAQDLAKQSGGTMKCKVIKGKALEDKGLVGLINVGKASENPPCMIELTYEPKSAGVKGCCDGTVLLVGKTICYDTGGLSLKISNGMKGMKYDKNGGMAVLGAMHAVSTWLKPCCRIVALLPAAENSISDEAYRPDDILTYLNGVTVEVTNTDAEGRLVLADGLAYGCKVHKPTAIIDMATLTGGVVVALGQAYAGYWCDDATLRGRVEQAGETAGERVWRLPLTEPYRDMMKSQHADIWNSAPVRHAHPIQGAAFLSYFVDSGIPWAHIDIAGTSATDKPRPPFEAGPTGFGVRLLANLFESWCTERD
ncbi:MAG: leucyl aminopeptidase family protein [Planctomycetes bacterium]|nr:leucyl aminopeptidase family protein [Planctomycetota bacterium]NOG56052.1 leucyl aminopeptidase family protein [Planctomycetota bacterium]